MPTLAFTQTTNGNPKMEFSGQVLRPSPSETSIDSGSNWLRITIKGVAYFFSSPEYSIILNEEAATGTMHEIADILRDDFFPKAASGVSPEDFTGTLDDIAAGTTNKHFTADNQTRLTKIHQAPDYVVYKSGSNTVATSIRSDLSTITNADASVVLQGAINALTTGGSIVMAQGIYDGLSPMNVAVDNISIQGQGKYLTKLKLKASADTGSSTIAMFYCYNDNFSLSGVELDGNGINQTKIDNGSTGIAKSSGVIVEGGSYPIIKDCYIHDFTSFGIWFFDQDNGLIENCRLEDNYWNNITFGYTSSNNIARNCVTKGSGDVSISLYGTDNYAINCFIGDCDGDKGSQNSRWGIGFETHGGSEPISTRNKAIGNTITGENTMIAIRVDNNSVDGEVKGNTIFGLTTDYSAGIVIDNADNYTISGNTVYDVAGNGFRGGNLTNSSILNNHITGITIIEAMRLSTGSTGNVISGNTGIGVYGMQVDSGADNNRFIANTFTGNATGRDFVDEGSSNTYRSIYKGFDAAWVADSGRFSNTINGLNALGSTIKATTIGMPYFPVSPYGNSIYDGGMALVAVYLDAPSTITGAKFLMNTQGNYTASDYNGVALFSVSGSTLTLVASSANDGDIWKAASGTIITKAFTTPYVAQPGLYYIGALYNNSAETTAPQLGATNTGFLFSINQGEFTNGRSITARTFPGAALPASFTITSGDAENNTLWAAIY